jgi:TPR repeat protein
MATSIVPPTNRSPWTERERDEPAADRLRRCFDDGSWRRHATALATALRRSRPSSGAGFAAEVHARWHSIWIYNYQEEEMTNLSRAKMLLPLSVSFMLWACHVSVGSGHGSRPSSPNSTGCGPGAVATCEQKCQGGDGQVCAIFAGMYAHGDGVASDQRRASELFQKSCDAKFGPGCFVLGIRYGFGNGLPQDDSLATAAYRRACEYGDGAGCESAGNAYLQGRYVPKDEKLGTELCQRAAQLGRNNPCEKALRRK